MKEIESLTEFYRRKFTSVQERVSRDLGHFNIFRHEKYVEGKPTSIPYRRRDFYKIMLVRGSGRVHYADRVVDVKKQALSFSNPMIPYKWERLDRIRDGIYCIFDTHFFQQYGQFQQYEVFQPHGMHIFELTGKQAAYVEGVFLKMETELNSDYQYKFDLIRNLVLELVHFALKLQPSGGEAHPINASQRIAMMFTELLERQFPIDDSHSSVSLRTPSAFARQLNVHVNHLNRAVKVSTQKTTSQLIAERVLHRKCCSGILPGMSLKLPTHWVLPK